MRKKSPHKKAGHNSPSTTEKGRLVEQIVAAFHDQPNTKVERNVFLPVKGEEGRYSEIDVLISSEVAGIQIRIAVECKNEIAPIGTPKINQFIGKLDDVGIPTVLSIYVSTSRYTSGAIKRARKAGIKLRNLAGLTKDGLSAAFVEAVQAVVHLLATVTRIGINHEVETPEPKHPFLLFTKTGEIVGWIHDFVWHKWIRGFPPSAIGEHSFQLDIPPGCQSLIDGKLYPIEQITITVQVSGLVITLPGKAEQYILVDAVDKKIEQFKINTSFDTSITKFDVTTLKNEEELKAFLAKQGVVQLTQRIRLPRIECFFPFYWPPTERIGQFLEQRIRAFLAGEIPEIYTEDIGEIEGTDLKSMWEPLWHKHPAATKEDTYKAHEDQSQSNNDSNPNNRKNGDENR